MPQETTINEGRILTITSLLSILLLSLHVVDDIVRGFDPPGLANFVGIAILVVLLYGTLILRERIPGIVIMLVGSVFAAAMPAIHLRSPRIAETAASDWGYFFIWTLWALGVTGFFGIILCIRSLVRRFLEGK